MKRRVLLIGVAVAGLAVAGAGMTSALMDLPQDAVPVQDPVGDLLRDTNRTPLQNPQGTAPAAPAQGPAPATAPTAAPGTPVVVVTPEAEIAAVQEDVPPEVEAEAPKPAAEPVATPGRRQRRPVAIVHAIDKVTAESMLFEVEVGGRPVRFNQNLIFAARACEVTTPDELTEDAIAYMDVSLQARGRQEGRQIFRGWMFASSPSVSGLQNPNYDAWVVGCKD